MGHRHQDHWLRSTLTGLIITYLCALLFPYYHSSFCLPLKKCGVKLAAYHTIKKKMYISLSSQPLFPFAVFVIVLITSHYGNVMKRWIERGLGVHTECTRTPNSHHNGGFISLEGTSNGGGGLPLDQAKTVAGVSTGVVFKEKKGKSVRMSW